MIHSVEFIFLGRIVPHTGIDHDLGLILFVNGISLVVVLDLAVLILLRRAEDIVAGADLAGSILNEVVIRQGGLFDQVQPGFRTAAVYRVKAVRIASIKIQETSIVAAAD